MNPAPSLKPAFSRFLGAVPGRLHAAAHSHHPWPDVSFEAHQRAWLDAAGLQDAKWAHVLSDVLPEAQRHVARVLSLPDPAAVAFGPNTHGFVLRLLSCLPVPARVLTTDAEFHSFDRQIRRLEEGRRVVVDRVASMPHATLVDRLAAAALGGGHDLVFLSSVLFDSGFALAPGEVADIVAAVPEDEAFVVVDGYHEFMARPADHAGIADRAFYLAGGYKYAMAGEGAVFLHCPPGYGPRPLDTGWFAGFGALEERSDGRVAYAGDGSRFLGATFDPTGLYRFNAVQRWLHDEGVDAAAVHAHVVRLQRLLLDALDASGTGLGRRALSARDEGSRGNFLSFRLPDAASAAAALADAGVVVDHRGDRLRVGLGLYHDAGDVEDLAARVGRALAATVEPVHDRLR